ncbi:hypothetical protein [Variovorax sp. GT1P44]|uniref:hypothetical protein n=1 Tax=Variovorax sp. GT1P44 TaxID=3443742 RepID=UPI003F477778
MNEQEKLVVLRIGGKYNWRNQPERLAYMGVRRYPGDRRTWHQFEKVDAPGIVWSEVLDSDLPQFEETEPAATHQE